MNVLSKAPPCGKNFMRLKLQQSEMRASQRSYAIAIPNIGRS
jgi:hypothetical protein